MVLKLSKKVHFLKFCGNLRMKYKSIKAIYIYAFERSRCAHLENGIVYCAMTAAEGAHLFRKCNCQHVPLTSPPRRQNTPPPPTPPSF